MSAPRWLAPGAAVAGLVGIVAIGSSVPAPPSAATLPAATQELLTGAAQVCPSSLEAVEASADVSAWALPERAAGPVEDQPGSSLAVVPLRGPDDPAPESAATTERGTTIGTSPDVPVLLRATGSLAPGLVGQSTVTAAGERSSGLASQPCVPSAREWWFVAGSGEVGRRATLLLANASSSAAVVDVQVWTESGPLVTAGTSDLAVPAFGTRSVSVDAVTLGSSRAAVHVRSQVGRLSAALLLREVDGADPVGLSWATASDPPALRSYVPGVPGVGERRARLLNPGEEDAIVRVRALAADGPFTPLGLEAVDVPAGTVVDVDLADAGDEDITLEVDANQPVVASVQVRQTPRSGLGDLAVIGATGTLDPVAAARVTSDDGRTSRLLMSAPTDDAAVDGSPAASPTTSPEMTAPPSPTTPPTPTESADQSSPSATPPPPPSPGISPSPTPTATPTASAAPTATAESDVIETVTTQAVVTVLDLDGSVLSADVVTVTRGATRDFTIELPDGVTDAWVVVEPSEPNLIMATLETTTTVDVPDPLDPEAQREAFWLDVVPLRPTQFTVAVPAVVPDIRAGLDGFS